MIIILVIQMTTGAKYTIPFFVTVIAYELCLSVFLEKSSDAVPDMIDMIHNSPEMWAVQKPTQKSQIHSLAVGRLTVHTLTRV